MINVILEVPPYPKARPRLTKAGRAYTPKETKKNERHIKYELRAKTDRLLLEEPISVEINFYLPRPKSAPKKRLYPDVRPDLDNYIKQIFDAGNEYVWKDDGCICEVISRKLYTSGKPYIHLIVEKIKPGVGSTGLSHDSIEKGNPEIEER